MADFSFEIRHDGILQQVQVWNDIWDEPQREVRPCITIVYNRSRRFWHVQFVGGDPDKYLWAFGGLSPYGGKTRAEGEAGAKRCASKQEFTYLTPAQAKRAMLEAAVA